PGGQASGSRGEEGYREDEVKRQPSVSHPLHPHVHFEAPAVLIAILRVTTNLPFSSGAGSTRPTPLQSRPSVSVNFHLISDPFFPPVNSGTPRIWERREDMPQMAAFAAIRFRTTSVISPCVFGSEIRIFVSQRFVSPWVESILASAPLSPAFPYARPSGRYRSASAARVYAESGSQRYSRFNATDWASPIPNIFETK